MTAGEVKEIVREWLDAVYSADRREFFEWLQHDTDYCFGCGQEETAGEFCQCRNDE